MFNLLLCRKHIQVNSQNDANNLAKQIQSTVKSITPGIVAILENGNY